MNTSALLPSLQEHLPKLEIVDLLRALIQAPSHPGLPRQEEQAVKVLQQYFDHHGIATEITEIHPGRPNLIARISENVPGKRLLLCGHTDTVPPNAAAKTNPFAAEIRENRVHGRGAVDMKGAVAAMAAALVALKNLNALQKGEVVLAAVIDEEMESLGAEALINSGFKAEAAIIGEPTSNQIALGHKGLEWLEVEFLGKATHGGTPQKGVNAIAAAARFVRMIEDELAPALQTRTHAVLGAPTINMGTIHGGDQPSTVAARCTIQLDRRWTPGESVEQVFAELEDILTRVRACVPGLKTALRRVPGGMATMIHGPLEITANHPLVLAAQKAREQIFGASGDLTAFPAWTDAALFSREAKIPSLVCGPGDLSLAHAPEESIAITEVEEAVKLYALTAVHFLNESE